MGSWLINAHGSRGLPIRLRWPALCYLRLENNQDSLGELIDTSNLMNFWKCFRVEIVQRFQAHIAGFQGVKERCASSEDFVGYKSFLFRLIRSLPYLGWFTLVFLLEHQAQELYLAACGDSSLRALNHLFRGRWRHEESWCDHAWVILCG